jgi:NAD-dependent DNA ligase
MRHQALSMGLTMNEHGLYVIRDKKKAERVNNVFTCEKDIFDYLHMEYKTPIERIDGRAVTSTQKNVNNVENKKPLLIIEDENEDDNFEIISKQPKKKTLKKKETIVKLEKPSPPKTKPKLIIEDDYNVKQIITDFRQNGILVLQKLNETQLTNILIEANNAYFNSESIMTDNEYDILKDLIEKKYPNNKSVTEIGAPIEKNKVTLPYQMASMDKIKPDTDVLKTWNKKYSGPYVLSCKLDGVSGLYTTEGSVAKLYTRGDGKVGQDVSHLISYLRLPKKKDLVIRGEFIIPKLVFDTKYKGKFANPRNMVAGIINQKATNETVNDLRFVVYEVIQPVMKPTEQMNFLKTLDVEYVLNTTENVLSNELLSHYLVDWRNNSSYELDGVIVTNDAIYERKTGNPEHSFAFKMVLSEQIAEAKVVDVIWTPSKDGYLKPRVQIEPIHLCGVKIEYATGFNGAFIQDNKVGIGAIIELIRSGDVIPHIRKVVVPAETAKMPSVSYEWNDTHIDVKLEDIESDETVKEKNITWFFKGIGVEGLSSGNVSRIIHAGYNSVSQIIKMTIDDLLEVEGFQIKTATKIHDGIKEKIEAVSLVTIMSSSNLFGRGFSEKKLELIMDSYPKVLLSTETVKQKIAKVAAIKGMAEKTSEAFVERIPYFIQFMKECNLVNKLALTPTVNKHVDTEHCLYGKSIIMTGFRDNVLQTGILNVGGKIGSSVSKNTFMVLVKDLDEDTGKAEEARKLGVPIMTPSLFKSKYL